MWLKTVGGYRVFAFFGMFGLCLSVAVEGAVTTGVMGPLVIGSLG